MLSGAAGGAGEVNGGGSREFYEFVLPPIDIHEDPSGPVTVVADVPGFGMEDISVRVSGDLLTIRAEKREKIGAGPGKPVSLQRPRRLDKTVRLPGGGWAEADAEAGQCTATCSGGVLTVTIPRSGRPAGA